MKRGKRVRIAVDAMGGDFAPYEIVAGSLEAVERYKDLEIVLVGDEDAIRDTKIKLPDAISIHHTKDSISMHEQPALALRRKPQASIAIATKMVHNKEADAVVSAGSTGAQMTAALLFLGRIKGVERPAIVTVYPTFDGGKLLLDVGANTDCTPEMLVQFAHMGSIYAEHVLAFSKPRVALLNNGEEEGKGSPLTKKTYQLLKEVNELNFIGNLEGRDIIQGNFEVLVCDGFVGNVVLKLSEGLALGIMGMLKEEFSKSITTKIGAALVMPGLKKMKSMLDYAEYGGAPLLGVKGVSVICHGSSKAKAIKNAIRVAQDCVRNNFLNKTENIFLGDDDNNA